MSNLIEFVHQYVHVSLLLPLLFTVLALLFMFFLMKCSQRNHKTPPPSPPRLPIIGNLHQLGSHPHRSLQSLAQTYGPIMLVHLGSIPVAVFSSADAAQEVLKTHDLAFSNRPKSSIAEKLLYHCNDIAMAPYGEYWRQIKSISVLHLLSNRRVTSYRNVRQQEIANMIGKIRKCCSLSSPINLSEMLVKLTKDIVCRVAFGRKYSEDNGNGRSFKELLSEFVELLGCFNVGDYIPWLAWMNHVSGLNARVEKVAREFDSFLDKIVEEHMQRHVQNGSHIRIQDDVQVEDYEDFVDVLLKIQKEDSLGFCIDRISIKALLLDVFAAGTDTTFAVLEWTMSELLRHPDAMRKLQNELRKIASGKAGITEDDLHKMHYLRAVIKETLRFHPPIPLLVPREAIRDVTINGFHIEAKTQAIINASAIGRDPALWNDAEKFRPERFLDSSIDFRGQDFQLIPFGAGRRGCPGIQFAVSIDEIALANILLEFDWELPDGGKGEDLDMTESTGLTMHRKTPLIAVATPFQ